MSEQQPSTPDTPTPPDDFDDFDAYLASRPSQDANSRIHEAGTGRFMSNPNEQSESAYYSDQIEQMAIDEDDRFSDKSLRELAMIIREARQEGDSTLENDARPVFDQKFIETAEKLGWEGVVEKSDGTLEDRNKIADERLALYESWMDPDTEIDSRIKKDNKEVAPSADDAVATEPEDKPEHKDAEADESFDTSWIDDRDPGEEVAPEATSRERSRDIDFSWIDERDPGEEAALEAAPEDTQQQQTVRQKWQKRASETVEYAKRGTDKITEYSQRAAANLGAWYHERQIAEAIMTEPERKRSRRRRLGAVIGVAAVTVAATGVSMWMRSSGFDAPDIDTAAMPSPSPTPAAHTVEPIIPSTGLGDVFHRGAEAATSAGDAPAVATGGGGGGSGIGALSGEVIEPSAWNVPKGSGGEQLMERLGADKKHWYEHQNQFLKRFPSEAYRMPDGNVGLKLDDGRLSAKAVEFWKTAIR